MKRTPPPFARLRGLHPPASACQLDAYFPEWTDGEWRLLALEARDAVELANGYDPLDEPPVKRHQPVRRSTAATSTRPGTVAVSTAGDDPLKSVDLCVYFAAHGIEVPPSGKVRCIAPDHEDVHPSCTVTSSHFRCWACGARGDIIDAASLFHGIPVRGAGYWKLRDLVLEVLVWAPLHRGADR
jgi:hypothetical protein